MSERKPLDVVGWLGSIGYSPVIVKNAPTNHPKPESSKPPKASSPKQPKR